MTYYVHPKALVESMEIGPKTRIWAFAHISSGVVIGENCNICDHTYIESHVRIGNNVTIKSGVYIWDGVHIHDNVFIGPNVTFTNDLRPRSKCYPDRYEETIVEQGASIGANATIVAGNHIGKYAMVGAGSVVTKAIPNNTLWYGNPAVFRSFICDCGEKLDDRLFCAKCSCHYKMKTGGLERITS
ncbi:N-acetyltransferase [Paenibacillus sp. KQZ6P-2]|uniref:N-acetyltransferase n=1 Tax=Paenibacillus mangrovi TaxID=2931978 RepID=A0A9X1WTA6_9BACL|nr:acyltransferase [Paenibacillus mangrovi]MCJ8013525.1 N-acetyltransferase [Paenibacillus mangrovi]